jgi:hypothetical protein
MLGLLLPMSGTFGPVGSALATGIRFLVMIPLVLYLIERTTPVSVVDAGRVAAQPVLATAGMAGIVLLFQRQIGTLSPVFVLGGSIIVGVISYVVFVYVTDLALGYEAIRFVKP